MSAPTLEPAKPRSRLLRLATLDRLATAVTWVFWFFAALTALQVILALTRSGTLLSNALLGLLVTWPVDWVHWPASWGLSWPVEWFGLSLIIFARIMRVSAAMRADLDGTV